MFIKWFLAILAILGGFFLAGVVGFIAADFIGLWPLPVAGFNAAFAVVVVAYIAVPTHKMLSSAGALTLGAVVAWHFLEPSFFPESYGERGAYQPTHLPIIATYAGGIIGFVIAAGFGHFARLNESV